MREFIQNNSSRILILDECTCEQLGEICERLHSLGFANKVYRLEVNQNYSQTKLGTLPTEVRYLTNLKEIYIRNNELSPNTNLRNLR